MKYSSTLLCFASSHRCPLDPLASIASTPAHEGLRAPLAPIRGMGGVGRSCCSFYRITAFSPSRAAHALHAGVLAAVGDP